MKFFLSVFILFFTSAVVAQTSYVAPSKILQKKGYQIGLSSSYFSASERVDFEGKREKYEENEAFTRIESELSGFYAPDSNFQLGVGLRFRQNQFTLSDEGDEKTSETNSGVESTFASIIYAFEPVNRIYYSLEGTFRFRPFTNEEVSEGEDVAPILGDDGPEYSLGGGFHYTNSASNSISGRFGYRNPGKDLSDELYWQLEGALVWKYLALVVGVDGISSLKNDPYQNDESTRPIYNTGASFLYASRNREVITPYAGVNLGLGKNWRVELKGAQVVEGRSTDLGTIFGFSLIRRVEDTKVNKKDKVFKEYDFEANVIKLSSKKGYLVIDKGLADDIRSGARIDFYEFNYVGGNVLLARGLVVQSKAETAIVKITQIYNPKKSLKEGMLARGNYR